MFKSQAQHIGSDHGDDLVMMTIKLKRKLTERTRTNTFDFTSRNKLLDFNIVAQFQVKIGSDQPSRTIPQQFGEHLQNGIQETNNHEMFAKRRNNKN